MLGMIFDLDSVLLKLINERIGNVLSCNLKLDLSMRKGVSLKYWYSVG